MSKQRQFKESSCFIPNTLFQVQQQDCATVLTCSDLQNFLGLQQNQVLCVLKYEQISLSYSLPSNAHHQQILHPKNY